MLDHLEEAFCVYRIDVHFGLQSAHFGGPRHRLTSDAVGSEFHQALVEGIEVAFVLDVDTFLNDGEFLTRIELLSESSVFSLVIFVTLAFNIKVEIYRHDREFTDGAACLKVGVLWLFMAAQLPENVLRGSYDRLSKSLEELYVQIQGAVFS